MGVYTNVERTLGLTVSKKMIEIRNKFDQGIGLSREEMVTLFNEAARFETIIRRIRAKDYHVADKYSLESYEIASLLGDLMTELNKMNFMKLDEKRKYHISLCRTHIIGGQRLSIPDMMTEIEDGVLLVRLKQENFDANNDDYQVVGTFDSLRKDYGIDMSITTEDNLEDIKKRAKAAIKEALVKEMKDLESNLSLLE